MKKTRKSESRVQGSHLWTKKEIALVAKLWESKTKRQVAIELGVTEPQVTYIVGQIRKAGYDLPHKKLNGNLRVLIKETLG